MEINERMKDVLQVQLSPLGLELKPEDRFPLTVLHDDRPVAYIHEDGAVYYPVDRDTTPARRIPGVIAKVWEMEQAYRQAPHLELSGVNSYKKNSSIQPTSIGCPVRRKRPFSFCDLASQFRSNGCNAGPLFLSE